MPRKQLANVPCPLDQALLQLVPGSERYAAQIQKERAKNEELKRKIFIVRDFPMLTEEDGEIILHFSRINPGFKHPDEYCHQIRQAPHFYAVQDSDAARVKKSKTTIIAPYSKLELITDNEEFCHFNIPTKNRDSLNDTQRTLSKRTHPDPIMKTLGETTDTTRFYLPTPKKVKNALAQLNTKAIARVGVLGSFLSDSDFYANDRSVGNSLVLVRGVPVSAGGAAPKILTPSMAAILKYSKNFVPKVVWDDYKTGLRQKFRK